MIPNRPFGARVMRLVDDLARHTDGPGLTRLYLSPAHRRTVEAVRALMEEAGLAAHVDAVGNAVGRFGPARGPVLLIGSHVDSVVDAGRFDGPLGVVAGLVAIEALAREGADLPFAIELLAFGDEENVRFPTNLSTAYAVAGRYDPAWLDGRDADGVSLRQALEGFGADPEGALALGRDPGEVVGYLEVHIEQGPVLEAEDLPVGVVSGIVGISRRRCHVTGEAGHAGTVPMTMRRDALAGAAEMIGAIERIGARRDDTVATVGVARPQPGAVNVIPARVDFTIDARCPDDAVRAAMMADIASECGAIAARRGVAFGIETTMESPATPMDPALTAALEGAMAASGLAPRRLVSGAGHDAVAMATLGPTAMLFVRCLKGISHNPAESITAEDADVAVRVLVEAIKAIGRARRGA